MNTVNIHEARSTQTVSEYLKQFELDVSFNASSFLSLNIAQSSDGSITNLSRIQAQYTKQELTDSASKSPSEIIIKKCTQIGLPNGVLRRRVGAPKVQPDLFQLTKFTPFISAQLKQLLSDPNYRQISKDTEGQSIARTETNEITVYVWIRSISDVGTKSQQGSWYNISAFVEQIQTTVTKSAGSFALSLVPVAAEFDKTFGWHLDNIKNYEYGDIGGDILSAANISKYKNKQDNFYSREDFFFNTVLQENDLIYIRFEKLAMEDEISLNQHAFSGSDVPGKVYDMIGLIDSVTTNTSINSVITSVIGRDLMKVFIEDGSYFFPEQFAQQLFTDPDSKLTKRNKIEEIGNALISTAYSFKPVSVILKYIFNKFSNMGMVPSSVFDGYGERSVRSKYQLKTSALLQLGDISVIDEVNNTFLKEDREGVWRIMEMIFDPQAANRVLADNTISTDNGSIINSMNKICQEPFIEIYGDTYGDKYYVIIRKPPFDEKGYKGLVYGDSISENVNDGVNTNNALSHNGKLSFKLLKNKPANIDELHKELNRKEVQRLKLNGRAALISDLVIDIDESDVISDSFSYSDETYSWYRVIPRGLGVQNDITSFQLAPVIPLDEYAEIFGNKMYTIEYNYAPLEFIDDSYKNKDQKYAEAQAFYDLQFVIQSNAYLPFTRQGTIRINGNRTIKRGMFIYYKPTDEIFYVDAVLQKRTQNDRETLISVSRGMREKYIKGVDVVFPDGVKKVSYFNIVNTSIDNTASINNKEFLKNWKVDKSIFNFFLQRRQWTD